MSSSFERPRAPLPAPLALRRQRATIELLSSWNVCQFGREMGRARTNESEAAQKYGFAVVRFKFRMYMLKGRRRVCTTGSWVSGMQTALNSCVDVGGDFSAVSNERPNTGLRGLLLHHGNTDCALDT
ncbi:hypothetical protein EVAR_21724_1 [Eumeta japonica]|uniref:Uncharacterized protein n=1 Tax=Eumeta variegata TaxID=151549 RepID=A0A4C1W5G3_EUMVA|nr:hypothetical protein EVAR_21724_1 [Eumeta japonica]